LQLLKRVRKKKRPGKLDCRSNTCSNLFGQMGYSLTLRRGRRRTKRGICRFHPHRQLGENVDGGGNTKGGEAGRESKGGSFNHRRGGILIVLHAEESEKQNEGFWSRSGSKPNRFEQEQPIKKKGKKTTSRSTIFHR